MDNKMSVFEEYGAFNVSIIYTLDYFYVEGWAQD